MNKKIISLFVFMVLLASCATAPTATQAPGSSAAAPEPSQAPGNIPLKTGPAQPVSPTAAVTQVHPETPAAPTAENKTYFPETSKSAPTVSSLPDPAGYQWAPFASGLDKPVDLKPVSDGSGRLFVLEKPGRIKIIEDGKISAQLFLDITDRVGMKGMEQGLLGITFHPKFEQNGYFYVNYTDLNGNTVIARYSVSKQNKNLADPASEKVLLHVDQPFANHNGGSMLFGPDGYLYMGLGDGGSAGDPYKNAQNTSVLLGKLLRINVDAGDPYAIPPDNPFSKGGGRPEVWEYGLRNPWRVSFDSITGDLYIADVGQDSWEEIDFVPANSNGGLNFGWNLREGMHPYNNYSGSTAGFTNPVAEYDHGQGCSVTGGYVYRGQKLPEWQGVYLYGDFCSGKVWGLLHKQDGTWQNAVMFTTDAAISSFGLDETGEVYLLDLNGSILRLERK